MRPTSRETILTIRATLLSSWAFSTRDEIEQLCAYRDAGNQSREQYHDNVLVVSRYGWQAETSPLFNALHDTLDPLPILTPQIGVVLAFLYSGWRYWPGAVETAETGADTDMEREKQPELADVSEEAVYLLKDIARKPNRTLMERYEDLFSYNKKGVRAKQELFKAGLVDETEVAVPEGTAKVVYVTDRGETLLNDADVAITTRGRGGPVHRHFQFRIRDAFQQEGWDAAVERHDADVFAEQPDTGRTIAVEVAMEARDREIEHVRDRLAAADNVWVACRNDVVRSKLQKRLQEQELLTEDVRVDLFTAIADVSSYL